MKRLFISIFVFLLIILISNNVNALDNPMCEPFSAYISNKNGAKYFNISYGSGESNYTIEEVGNLKYNDKIDIIEEYKVENEIYGYFSIESTFYYIKISDLKPIDELYEKIDYKKEENIIVFEKNGTQMRKGPSSTYYSLVDTIPEGTVLKAKFSEEYDTSGVRWLFVEYNGKKGWVNCESNEIGFLYDFSKNVLLTQKLDVFEDPEYNIKIDEIDKNTVINTNNLYAVYFNYFFMNDEMQKNFAKEDNEIYIPNYINYEGKEGFVRLKDYAIECNENYTVKNYEESLFEEPNADSKVLLSSISVGTVLYYDYYSKVGNDIAKWNHGKWIHTTYDNKSGWVQAVDEEYLSSSKEAMSSFQKEITEPNRIPTYKIVIIGVLSITLIVLVGILIYIKKEK